MNLPQPFWAICLAFMGAVIGLCVLFHPGQVNVALAVLALGANLISGALGAFAGHASAQKDSNNTTLIQPVVTPDPLGK